MELAKLAAAPSDDATKVGCVLVKDGVVVSAACNGMPAGVVDVPYRRQAPDKYAFFEHAERNCLYDCCRRGVATQGAEAFVTLFCCVDCARGFIRAGVRKVTCPEPDWSDATWGQNWGTAHTILLEAGVEVDFGASGSPA